MNRFFEDIDDMVEGALDEFAEVDSEGVSVDQLISNIEELDNCRDFREIFTLVKRSVKETLHVSRTGLMLYLADLPLRVGAFHRLSSNGIVLNRTLLNMVATTTRSGSELNSFVYSILLHEYLHSLGYVDERKVRRLVYRIARRTFGKDHIVTEMAVRGPWRVIPRIPYTIDHAYGGGLEVVREFEEPDHRYIV